VSIDNVARIAKALAVEPWKLLKDGWGRESGTICRPHERRDMRVFSCQSRMSLRSSGLLRLLRVNKGFGMGFSKTSIFGSILWSS
jgi:hypothetical protein